MYALYTNKEKFVSGKRINRRQHHEYAKELETLITQYEKTKVEYVLNLEVAIKVHFDFKKDVYKVGKKEFYITDSEKLFLYQYFIASVPRERKTIKYKLIKKFGVDIFYDKC